VGDAVELVGPNTKPFAMEVPMMRTEAGEDLPEARTPQMLFKMQLPKPVPRFSILRRQVELSGK